MNGHLSRDSRNDLLSLMPIANKPLVVHQLEWLASHGVNDVLLSAAPQDLVAHSRLLGSGERFGVRIQYTADLPESVDSISDERSFLILNGWSLTDLDITQFYSAFTESAADMLTAVSKGLLVRGSAVLNPRFCRRNALKSLFKPAVSEFQASEKYRNSLRFELWQSHFNLLPVHSPDDLHTLNMKALSGDLCCVNYQGYRFSDSLWKMAGSRLAASARLIGRNVIGDNSLIHNNVTLENCVIGDNVLIAENTVLRNTVVLSGTYVGPGMQISASLLRGNMLYDAENGEFYTESDSSSMGWSSEFLREYGLFPVGTRILRDSVSELGSSLKSSVGSIQNNLTNIAALLILSVLLLSGCLVNPDNFTEEFIDMKEMQVPDGFVYSTKKSVSFDIRLNEPGAVDPYSSVRVDVSRLQGEREVFLFSGLTDGEGAFQRSFQVPVESDDFLVRVRHIGMVDHLIAGLENDRVSVAYHRPGAYRQLPSDDSAPAAALGKASGYVADHLVFPGGWNSLGVPDYLEARGDDISAEFLQDLNASLPEQAPVPLFHPEYIAEGSESNIVLKEDADVFVTFVHEGAGYKNVLAYYTYSQANPPQSTADITAYNVIFPNISYLYSGGGLRSGDKVYLGHFQQGTVIGWALLANGWGGSSGPFSDRNVYYSNSSLNPENTAENQKHNVLLYDPARDITVLGFEDLNRDSGSDDDFNDALFYVTSLPFNAISTDNLQQVTYTGDDFDGDGVKNNVDVYPEDATRAYENFYPGRDAWGSLAFEDNWPAQGDYDFNDMIIDYYFREVVNADNEVVEVEARFTLKAAGAAYENGFGFEMPVSPDMIASVTGTRIFNSFVSLNATGTEAGQDRAVIIAFDDLFGLMTPPSGYYINTQMEAPVVTPDTISIMIQLTQPLSADVLGYPPYNPFIIVDRDRDREVHLAGYPPTSLVASSSYFNSQDDASAVSGYYMTLNNLPWGLDITGTWNYPLERTPINQAHLWFANWAESGGSLNYDWYKSLNGYQDTEKIYSR